MEIFPKNRNETKDQNQIESLNPIISKQSEVINRQTETENSQERDNLINSKRDEILDMLDDRKNNIENEEEIKEGIDFVFEQNSELEKIGTKEQYSKYLDTIFPDSKVTDIVYHGTVNNFDEFNLNYFNSNSGSRDRKDPAFYFTSKSIVAKDFLFKKNGKILSSLLNIKNPEIIDGKHKNLIGKRGVTTFVDIPGFIKNGKDGMVINDVLDIDPKAGLKRVIDGIGNEEYYSNIYATFGNNQSFILGSKQDLENFKKFLENNKDS
ncbi:TPA: hypothetical protein DIC38_00390 [Candidatus Nomurabacteria bacterium]|nr:MAG: hypothetical protein O210_OD1C00001G0654 [Parcubacteria bacterium RAAC4_OD1_1]HCY26131.1 hypothetical protein [Candidatus Nomurabacteria bacterium]